MSINSQPTLAITRGLPSLWIGATLEYLTAHAMQAERSAQPNLVPTLLLGSLLGRKGDFLGEMNRWKGTWRDLASQVLSS